MTPNRSPHPAALALALALALGLPLAACAVPEGMDAPGVIELPTEPATESPPEPEATERGGRPGSEATATFAVEDEAGSQDEAGPQGQATRTGPAGGDAADDAAGDAAEGLEARFDQVRFRYDPAIAPFVIPARVAGATEGPEFALAPEHIAFALQGYPTANDTHAPRILVYPVAGFSRLSPAAADRIAALEALLETRPVDPEGPLPFLPVFNADQVFQAQLRYLDFEGGSGIRYLTQYDQAPLPIQNRALFYTFQGLTDDGRYAISAILPVSTELLPEDGLVDDPDAFAAGFEAYVAETAEALDDQAEADFAPDLAALDRMLESLQIE